MKKAVITTGGKQYLVAEGDSLEVELLAEAKSPVSFETLLVVDGDKVSVGTPIVDKFMVTAKIDEANIQADKVTSIRYKAKKRVHKVRGHRQRHAKLTITKIGA